MEVKISVISPVYNMSRYLPECLDSILSQTLKDIEIIAVNDGSTDNSLEILRKYQERHDNIVVLNQDNQGAGVARNNAIKHARGKYLIFIDPDDYYPSDDCLEALYNAAESNHMLICGGAVTQINNGVRTNVYIRGRENLDKDTVVKLKDYKEIYGHTRYLFQTELIRKNQICFKTYRRFQDQPFTIKALVCAGEFLEIQKVVYEYRVGHKKLHYSEEICLDILCGVRDVYQLIADNNLRQMYECSLKDFLKNFTWLYRYAYAGSSKIDRTLEEINRIMQQWLGETVDIITKEDIKEYREELIGEYKRITEQLCNAKKIILYGAGDYTQKFLRLFPEIVSDVIGVAVTDKRSETKEKIGQLRIRQIDEYQVDKEDVQVYITTMPKYWNEIKKKLAELHFYNIKEVDVGKLMKAVVLISEA